MIDFTNAIEELNAYKGSEKKKTLLYEKKRYLVKFPDPVREKNKNISYINNAFSEYVGSNVFRLTGFETQNVILGKYQYKAQEKIVCACEDFTDRNHILYEFENLVLSANPDKKIETELSDILEVIDESKILNIDEVKEKFWDMFIVDGLIGNTDRHNGNWGFLLDIQTNEIKFAPIYDCSYCLNPMLEDSQLEKLNETEMKSLAINTCSCMKENGKKINYMNYLKSAQNEACNQALKRVFRKINIEEIQNFIVEIEGVSDVRKTFYQRIIELRYEMLKEMVK